MNYLIETHAHTIASGHAYSTIREMADAALDEGLEVLALTEHAPEMPGSCTLSYFRNLKILPKEFAGLRMLYGVELNIMDEEGSVDLPQPVIEEMDIVIASIHSPGYGKSHGIEENTQAYVKIMENPYINIIGHPDDGRYPVDYEVLVKKAKETHTLLEINNSSLRPDGFRKNTRENATEMLTLCKELQVPMVIGTDAHCAWDVGNIALALDLIEEVGFPEELIVNDSMEKLLPYINLGKRGDARWG